MTSLAMAEMGSNRSPAGSMAEELIITSSMGIPFPSRIGGSLSDRPHWLRGLSTSNVFTP